MEGSWQVHGRFEDAPGGGHLREVEDEELVARAQRAAEVVDEDVALDAAVEARGRAEEDVALEAEDVVPGRGGGRRGGPWEVIEVIDVIEGSKRKMRGGRQKRPWMVPSGRCAEGGKEGCGWFQAEDARKIRARGSEAR